MDGGAQAIDHGDSLRRGATNSSLAAEVRDLQGKVERMSLTCQAMWELLREYTGMSEQTILERIKEIDLRDGKEDGKMSITQVECPNCGKLNNSRRSSCVYCGQEFIRMHVFE